MRDPRGLSGKRPRRAPVNPSFTRAVHWPRLFTPRVALLMDVYLSVEGWADACIVQALEIDISLTIAKS